MSQEFLTVSELNQYIKDVINSGFPQTLWVCGEIQGFNRNKDKSHVFFELIEKEKNSRNVKSRIGLVIFANRKLQIQNILKKSENAFSLKDDIEVKFACKIDYYAPHGAVRLVVESIDPVYTLGKLAQDRQQLIAELKQKGVLDKNKTLSLPLVPLSLGLITSDDSAAYNDFLSELQKSGFGFKIYVRNTIMQGKNTPADVCAAIKELEGIKDLDVILITRGGGSIADLSCFDNKDIVEAIAGSRLPILSGIGHEINTTITDLAAHTFAKTPTALAQGLVKMVTAYLDTLDEKMKVVIEEVQSKIQGEQQRLKDVAMNLHNTTHRFLKSHNERVTRLEESLTQRPQVFINDSRRYILSKEEALGKIVKQRFQEEHVKLNNFTKIIDILHPVNTLKRGFSITRNAQGKIIRRLEDIDLEDQLQTELVGGNVISLVQKKNKL